MFLKRAFNSILLTAFAVFSAGGPGLHYAPFLGHHHSAGHHLCSDHQATSETGDQSLHESCGCGEVHGTSENSNARTQLAEKNGHSHSCDHQCLICQFFASITFESVTEFTLTGDQQAYQLSAGPAESVDSQFFPAFYQRGPPVACLIV